LPEPIREFRGRNAFGDEFKDKPFDGTIRCFARRSQAVAASSEKQIKDEKGRSLVAVDETVITACSYASMTSRSVTR
jgi:hypothetical protein